MTGTTLGSRRQSPKGTGLAQVSVSPFDNLHEGGPGGRALGHRGQVTERSSGAFYFAAKDWGTQRSYISPQGHPQISLRGSSYSISTRQRASWATHVHGRRGLPSVGMGRRGSSSWEGQPSWELSAGSGLWLGAQERLLEAVGLAWKQEG